MLSAPPTHPQKGRAGGEPQQLRMTYKMHHCGGDSSPPKTHPTDPTTRGYWGPEPRPGTPPSVGDGGARRRPPSTSRARGTWRDPPGPPIGSGGTPRSLNKSSKKRYEQKLLPRNGAHRNIIRAPNDGCIRDFFASQTRRDCKIQ